ncbi:hypothetical protein PNF31_27450 [Priestia megaterium]|nr:hypothetical protein [Priestia megaterium]MDC7724440.1 hypothetical protein [Priestia megaterium]
MNGKKQKAQAIRIGRQSYLIVHRNMPTVNCCSSFSLNVRIQRT